MKCFRRCLFVLVVFALNGAAHGGAAFFRRGAGGGTSDAAMLQLLLDNNKKVEQMASDNNKMLVNTNKKVEQMVSDNKKVEQMVERLGTDFELHKKEAEKNNKKLRKEMQGGFKKLRKETKEDIKKLRKEMKEDYEDLAGRIDSLHWCMFGRGTAAIAPIVTRKLYTSAGVGLVSGIALHASPFPGGIHHGAAIGVAHWISSCAPDKIWGKKP